MFGFIKGFVLIKEVKKNTHGKIPSFQSLMFLKVISRKSQFERLFQFKD